MHLKGNHSARVGFLTRQGPDMKPKRTSFDAAALRVLEELVNSTWAIIQARHPFRNLEMDPNLQTELRQKLFILAENHGLTNLDKLQRLALQAVSQPPTFLQP